MSSSLSRVVLYINGVRFYPSTVSVAAQRNGFSSFTVTLPSIVEWSVLPRRSHGALFFVDPVTRTWRLLCEGEYSGFGRSKMGDGHRSLSLTFRSLHATWNKTKLFNTVPSQEKEPITNEAADAVVRALANGVLVDKVAKMGKTILSFQQILDKVTTNSTLVSVGLPAFIETITEQTPVESFYMFARKWNKKYYILEDRTLGETLNMNLLNEVLTNGFRIRTGAHGLPIMALLTKYLQAAMYQMCPILAPPIYTLTSGNSTSRRIPEILFTPKLAFVVPPASNVIFADQILQQDTSVDYDTLITRLVGEVDSGVAHIPPWVFTNGEINENLLGNLEKEKDPTLALSHGFLSREELDAGIVTDYESFLLSKIQPQLRTQLSDQQALIIHYLGNLNRYTFEERRGNAQVQNLVCEFLPYLLPGFPCTVEDSSGPFTGIIESVSHSLSSDGNAVTSVVISHYRPSYIVAGTNRTPFYPKYLNARFLPAKIDDTYKRLFGTNVRKHSAMLPADQITAQTNTLFKSLVSGELTRCDLDALVGRVVSVPKFTCNYSVATGETESTIADSLRAAGIATHMAMQEYQFRAGTSLYDYCTFHDLDAAYGSESVDEGSKEPPSDLAKDNGRQISAANGHLLFGAPAQLELLDKLDPDWGMFRPVKDLAANREAITGDRQEIARMIQRRLREGASEG